MDMNRKRTLLAARAAVVLLLLDDDDFRAGHACRPIRFRRASIRRNRLKFCLVVQYLSDDDFRRAFRLSRSSFNELLLLLKPFLTRDEKQAACSSGGAIEPAVRLAVTLRLLAGGSYLDQMICFRLAKPTVYTVFHDTLRAILHVLPMPGVPLHCAAKLRELADGFSAFRHAPSPIHGCIGALDGIAIAIQKPPDQYVPRNFYCRKGKYALPVQAVVDYKYRFLYMTCKCVGSTHDSIAFATSSLAAQLRAGDMLSGFWIAGDAAYQCSEGLVTPWTKSALTDPEEGVYRDAFNFYHSSKRMAVEQAFGILFNRWGILWRPLSYKLVDSLPIISAVMRLHNFCVDRGDIARCLPPSAISHERAARYDVDADAAFTTWWAASAKLGREFRQQGGRRRDLEEETLRGLLTDALKQRGVTRPALS